MLAFLAFVVGVFTGAAGSWAFVYWFLVRNR